MTPYERTAAQKALDREASRAFEDQVRHHLPKIHIARTESTTELDFFLPHLYLEVKEKRQPLTKRWHLLEGERHEDLFVLDELSLRKALLHAPYAYFVLRDVPGLRIFLANALEVACVERVRRNRKGKGKLIVSLRHFRQLGSLDELMGAIEADVTSLWWKQSGCTTQLDIPQI